jgi:hypothetical protein
MRGFDGLPQELQVLPQLLWAETGSVGMHRRAAQGAQDEE